METGAITGYIDVAQLVLYAFWIFFAGLIFYLRTEDKREGYPLESPDPNHRERGPIMGFPPLAKPKVFRMPHGEGNIEAPRYEAPETVTGAEPLVRVSGEPLRPTGNPMKDGVGPASYAMRKEMPDLTIDGKPKVIPMRVATEFEVDENDPDPRGMEVVGADKAIAGTVTDLWVDLAEPRILFFEMKLRDAAEDAQTVMLPIGFATFNVGKRQINVVSITASQFADVPRIASPDQITRREEDMITAYFASGHLYATPERQEPLI